MGHLILTEIYALPLSRKLPGVAQQELGPRHGRSGSKKHSVCYTPLACDKHSATHTRCGLLRRGTKTRKRTPQRCSALSLQHWCPALHPAAHLRQTHTSALRCHRAHVAPDPLARIPRGPRGPRESGPGPNTRAREFKGWRHQSRMNPTCKDPARPSQTARVGARSNTRAREFKIRRRRAPHGGTVKYKQQPTPASSAVDRLY